MTDGAQGARLKIEYLPLSDLLRRRHPRNPKDHALEDLDDSMSRFGYTMPVAIDEKTGNLAAGHGRVDTLESRRQEGDEPPARVDVDEEGEWLVPTIRGIEFEDPDELLSYLLADNLLTEAGGWISELLQEDVEELVERTGEDAVLDGTGLSEGRLEEILSWGPEVPDPDPERDLPDLESDHLVEIRCSSEALAEMQPTLDEWSEREEVEVDVA